MGVAGVGEQKPSVSSGKRAFWHSSSARQTAEWPFNDASTDLIVEIGTASFSLHKFPLISRSGKIRNILSEAKDNKPTKISLNGIPGGPDSFELAAKFCYGLDVGISSSNVAVLHCAAHYLQMTEQMSENNLETRTEAFLREVVFSDMTKAFSVLHQCEKLLPSAEEVGLLSRLIDAITSSASKELASGLTALNPDFFKRVMMAFKSKGLKQDTMIKMLINYAHNSPNGIPVGDVHVARGRMLNAETLKRHRVLVEAIVGLLPCESRTSRSVPLVFLSALLKTATASSASQVVIADLERRVGMQLDLAILEDILIPAGAYQQHQLYDTDSISRIFSFFLNEDVEVEDRDTEEEGNAVERSRSPEERSMVTVAKLMDAYLAEIALDSNVMPDKFIGLAELLPYHSRISDDGLYKAVDVFLKVHTNITESERHRLCKTIDCQKLSQEACSHAAQNERLPVQMTVQVLYFEQLRLRNAMSGIHDRFFVGPEPIIQFPKRSSSGAVSPRDNYASVRRENRELKLEVARMRMRLTELEKEHATMKRELLHSSSARKACKWIVRRLSKVRGMCRWKDHTGVKKKKTTGGTRFLFQRTRQQHV